MREHPILFSGDMVRAILAGTKTQTRRPVKPCKDVNFGCELSPGEIAGEVNRGDYQNCHYGRPDDRLWVRETWWQAGHAEDSYPGANDYEVWVGSRHVHYAADGNPPNEPNRDYPRGLQGGHFAAGDKGSIWLKRPSIHMPRWACRLVLEVVSVRVERLKDITIADAQAEGFDGHGAIIPFIQTWERIYGNRGFGCDANPWVWVVEFKRTEASA